MHKPQDSAKTPHQVFTSRLFRSRLKLGKVLGSELRMDDTRRSEEQSQQNKQTMVFLFSRVKDQSLLLCSRTLPEPSLLKVVQE